MLRACTTPERAWRSADLFAVATIHVVGWTSKSRYDLTRGGNHVRFRLEVKAA
jgi:hypothetical protein